MKTLDAPEVDMLAVAQSSRKQRNAVLNFAPKIGLTMVNYAKLDAIDNFYIDCQNFRDYYRDPYSKLPKPEAFKRHYGEYGRKETDRNTSLLSLPVTWIQQRQPIVCPINYSRDQLCLNEPIRLVGKYDPTSCIRYKR